MGTIITIILAVCTIFGGIAALDYFREKRKPQEKRKSHPSLESIEKIIVESNPSDWEISISEPVYTTYFSKDVNLRFQIEFTEEGTQCKNFIATWANMHPNKSATGYWCYLYYGQTLLNRYILVSVDGARAMLPVPGERNIVEPVNYCVAKIHDSQNTLDEYMARSGLTVASEQELHNNS